MSHVLAKTWECDVDVNPQHASRIEFTCGACNRVTIDFSYIADAMFRECKYCGIGNLLKQENCAGIYREALQPADRAQKEGQDGGGP